MAGDEGAPSLSRADQTTLTPPPARDLWTLIGVEILGTLGSEIARFGVSVWVFDETQSIYAFSALLLANTVPGLLISPLAGHLIDTKSHARKQIMIGASIVSMIGTLIVLAGAFFAHMSMLAIVLGAGVASVAEAFEWPVLNATVPLMATKDDLPRYNGLLESGQAASLLAGPIIGGATFALLGIRGLLSIEIVSFLICVTVVSTLTIPKPTPEQLAELEADDEDEDDPEDEAASPADLLFGLKWILRHKPLLKFLSVAVFANFFLGVGNVLMTPYCLGILSEKAYGFASAAYGAGMILGGLVYGPLATKMKNSTIFVIASLVIGFLYSGYGLARSFASIAGMEFILSMLMTIVNAAALTLWQLKVPKEYAGRVLAAMWMVAQCTGPIAYLMSGVIADTFVPHLLHAPGSVTHWIGVVWGTSKSGQLGAVFSAIGAILFVGFSIALQSKDIRQLEDLEIG